MDRYLFALLIFLFATVSYAREAGPEYRVGFGARSRPIGAAADIEAGYDHPLWGAWNDDESPWYGYIGPRVRAISALFVNDLNLSLMVRPLSFLGFSTGRSFTARTRDESRVVDCNLVMCDGILRSDYFVADLTVGAGGYFYTGDADWRDFRPSEDREDFYEDSSALRGRRGYDRLFTHTHTVGMKIESLGVEDLIVGVTFKGVEFHLSGDRSERVSLISRYVHDGLRFSYAVGVYKSSVLETPGLAVGASVEWIPKSGLSL